MERPIVVELNVITNEETSRPMTDEEYNQYLIDSAEPTE